MSNDFMGEIDPTGPNAVTSDPRFDEVAFSTRAERHRHELRVHCYRLLGSFDEAEDLVQETLLRAWRARETLTDPSRFRAWLYRIATNACLDAIADRPASRRVAPAGDRGERPSPAAIPWLRPAPSGPAEAAAAPEDEPETAAVARETVELTVLAAIQHLPPRQRAALILRDAVGWSAADVADALGTTVAAANSATQRARATLRECLPGRRLDWAARPGPTAMERATLARYLAALDAADDAALAEVLAEDVRVTQQPWAGGNMADIVAVTAGRATVIAGWAPILHASDAPDLRSVAVDANGQTALASWIRMPGAARWQAFALTVLDIGGGRIAAMAVYSPDCFPTFGLPDEPTDVTP